MTVRQVLICLTRCSVHLSFEASRKFIHLSLFSMLKSSSNYLMGKTVTLLIGHEKKDLVVHEKLLCSASDYFDRMLHGNFKERECEKIDVSNQSADAVLYIISIMYAAGTAGPYSCGVVGLCCTKQAWLSRAVKAYILADEWLCSRVRAEILRAIHKRIEQLEGSAMDDIHPILSADAVNFAWENLPEGNPLRRLIVDFWIQSPMPILADVDGFGCVNILDYSPSFLKTAEIARQSKALSRHTMSRFTDRVSKDKMNKLKGYDSWHLQRYIDGIDKGPIQSRSGFQLHPFETLDVWQLCDCVKVFGGAVVTRHPLVATQGHRPELEEDYDAERFW
jgi:hypothetical protein